ncbi:MAG: enoyl-CoA hydratase [Bdellovibrionales bacterium GWA2_49_15]|nr:MAG: enoyl-CoA hydratase [Bdellovibrionales bacterium GWA2_49_15]
MEWKHLVTSIDKRGVATVTLNRPEIHNAFNDVMITELTQLFTEWAKQSEIRLVIITGAGKSFCAGGDINWMKKMKDYSFDDNVRDAKVMGAMFWLINRFPRPVIARVNGPAMGGGVGLLSAADYVLAVDSATFGLTETRLGLVPAVISPFVIAKIGHSHARATFLSGSRFDTKRAMEMGLVHQICNGVELDECLEKTVGEFLKAGPIAQGEAKDLIFNVAALHTSEEILTLTATTIARVRASREGQEGMGALLEKTTPSWVAEGR